MRPNSAFDATEPEVVRELIRENPWATLVSSSGERPVASHYPILLDEESEDLAILTHLGRPDEDLHYLGAGEMLCVVQGVHGYVSPSWYPQETSHVPTWNFCVAHCYGVPQRLDPEENLRVLDDLVNRFERKLPDPLPLDPSYGAKLEPGTVGIRLPVSHFVCKRKLSQNKDRETREQVIAALRSPGPYHHPALADAMERELRSEP